MTGIRLWICRTNSFGSPVMIVQVRFNEKGGMNSIIQKER
jgi:hypothetical protein